MSNVTTSFLMSFVSGGTAKKFKGQATTADCVRLLNRAHPGPWKRVAKRCMEDCCIRRFSDGLTEVDVIESSGGGLEIMDGGQIEIPVRQPCHSARRHCELALVVSISGTSVVEERSYKALVGGSIPPPRTTEV